MDIRWRRRKGGGAMRKNDWQREAVVRSRRQSDTQIHVVAMSDRMPILSIPLRSDGAKLSA